MERLTIKDIAKMAGVSHTTVSRALNGAQNIRPETYAKIMELCRTTGYTPNAAARQLKRSDSGAIGIIVPDISNAFFCELTRHLEWMTRQKGRNVFISSSFYDYEIEDENIRALMENRVSGIILSGVGDQTYLHLRNYLGKVPIVFLGDNIPEGMAVGLSFALAAQHAGEGAALSGALALALGIGIQNFPEGAAISLPLRQEGLSAGRAFLYGSASGVVEPVFGLLVVLAAGTIQPLMPWLLSFAAGAMMYVVVEELIPEAHLGEHSNTGTLGVMAGFLLMMVLDVALG